MSKLILILAAVFSSLIGYSQTFATDANPIDCHGAQYNLFDELDAGKIIVIGWTMPCTACTSPLLDVHNAILNFEISNPGVVEYWVNDDYNNTPCSTVELWAGNSGITNATFFSTDELYMMDYGSDGMPKVVVVACADHVVYYNVDNSPTGAGVTAAINDALNDMDNGCLVGLNDIQDSKKSVSCYPNPASNVLNLSFLSELDQNALITLRSISGTLIESIDVAKQINNGLNAMTIDVSSYENGLYFLIVDDGEAQKSIKIQINH